MTIKKTGKGYALFSKTGRKLSKVYKRKDSPSLKRRVRQVEFFKHKKG